MKKTTLPLLLAVAGAMLFPVLTAADSVVEEIIARVNNEIITRTEYAHSRDQLKQEAQQQNAANADRIVAEKQRDVLRDLIDQQLLVQRGKDMGITADNDVVKRLDEIRKSMNLESMDDLEKAAQQQGVSFEDFKNNMKNSIITQRVIGEEVGRRIQIPPAELTQYYEQHKQEFERPEQVDLAEILVSTEAPKAAAEPAKADDPSKPATETAKAPEAAVEDPARQILAERSSSNCSIPSTRCQHIRRNT